MPLVVPKPLIGLMPSSTPPPQKEAHSSAYWYIVFAVVAVAVLLIVSKAIVFACCSPTHIIRALCRFIRSPAEELDEGRDPIPSRKYSRELSDTECSVCLSAFVDGEDVRQMPECKHLFHAPCIDMWLGSHLDCPLCRSNVLPLAPNQREDSRQRMMESSRNVGVANLYLWA